MPPTLLQASLVSAIFLFLMEGKSTEAIFLFLRNLFSQVLSEESERKREIDIYTAIRTVPPN